MAINTSNKPDDPNGAKSKQEVDSKQAAELAAREADFNREVELAIRETSAQVGDTSKRAREVESMKVNGLWDAGKRISDLSAKYPEIKRTEIVKRFSEGISLPESYFSTAVNMVNRIEEADFKYLCENNVGVKTMKAIVETQDDDLRKLIIKRTVEEGLTEKDIRSINGSQGSRKEATGKRQRQNDSDLPPLRVFNKGIERVDSFSKILGSVTDAVGRLKDCKTEESRREAVARLVDFRKRVEGTQEELKAFLKQTAAFTSAKPGTPRK